MKVELVRIGEGFHFEGSGSSEIKIHTDASPEVGGENAGVRIAFNGIGQLQCN